MGLLSADSVQTVQNRLVLNHSNQTISKPNFTVSDSKHSNKKVSTGHTTFLIHFFELVEEFRLSKNI
jgi:hypothetical protein